MKNDMSVMATCTTEVMTIVRAVLQNRGIYRYPPNSTQIDILKRWWLWKIVQILKYNS